MPSAAPPPFGEIIVPLVTPFHGDGEIDREGIGDLVRFFVEEGADALLPTALTGEGPLLSEDETVLVWEAVGEALEKRKPLLPAILSFTTDRAIRLARRAEALGAAGILLAPVVPELYAGRSSRDVIRFYRDVAAASSLPIILFNYPSLTGVDLTASLVARLAEIEGVRAIKESTGDSRRIAALVRRLSDRLEVVCGAPTAALESFALGCRSWITGILNVLPRSGRQLLTAVTKMGDLALARRVYFEQILPFVERLEATSNPTGTIKAGMRARGLAVGVARLPGQDLLPEELREIDSLLPRLLDLERETEEVIRSRTAV